MSASPIDELSRLHGIGTSYHDYRGQLRHFSSQTKAAILAAMGTAVNAEHDANAALREQQTLRWMRMAPPVLVTTHQQPCVLPVSMSSGLGAAEISWHIELESSEVRSGSEPLSALQTIERADVDGVAFARILLPLPSDLPIGYHRLNVTLDSGLTAQLRLIITPAGCYEPRALSGSQRAWGVSVQLYSLRSRQNWGIGDFFDLRSLIEATAGFGCNIVGLNPLHALMPGNPSHNSPYSPSSRQFLNVLYIALPEVAEFAECEPAQLRTRQPEFQALLGALRSAPNVDYVRVAAAKFEIAKLLYQHFRTEHLLRDTARAAEFRKFVDSRGEPLRLHAIFDALDAHLRLQGPQYWGWPSWPDEYRDPTSSAVHRFARDRAQDVEYFLYLQWLATQQLRAAQHCALEHGMSIGLYGDVAVGANPAGSETWANRHLYLQDVSIGAPPDALALKGQDWGIPPQNPGALRAQEYQPFIDLLRNNMHAVAALRLDHVMTLFRLWWVPRGFVSTDGAYVHYPLEELIAILALESQRNRCVVIGEDLGTVPDQMRKAMERFLVYHYNVLLFEKESDGRFKAPSRYVRNGLATVTTHDLPTLRGWWEELDLALRDKLDLYPDAAIRDEAHASRARDREHLLHALAASGLWRWQAGEPLPPYSCALSRAIHAFLGLSNARMALIQMEDLIGMSDPVNVPGTDTEHPNWQRKICMDTHDIFARDDVRDLLQAMEKARRGENPNAEPDV